jgi:hypothetical protein
MVWQLWRGSRPMGPAARPDARFGDRIWRIALSAAAMGVALWFLAAALDPMLYGPGRALALLALVARRDGGLFRPRHRHRRLPPGRPARRPAPRVGLSSRRRKGGCLPPSACGLTPRGYFQAENAGRRAGGQVLPNPCRTVRNCHTLAIRLPATCHTPASTLPAAQPRSRSRARSAAQRPGAIAAASPNPAAKADSSAIQPCPDSTISPKPSRASNSAPMIPNAFTRAARSSATRHRHHVTPPTSPKTIAMPPKSQPSSAHLLRHPALGRADAGQLSRRAQALRREAGRAGSRRSTASWTCTRSPSGRTRPSCATPRARRPRASSPRASTRRTLDPVQPEPGAGPCRAGLDLQLRRPDGLDEPDDPVQGQGRQGPEAASAGLYAYPA